jgi:hypothetical protein
MPPRNSKGQAEGVGETETAKRFKALERRREAGTAQDYGSVVHGLILGVKTQSMKLTTTKSHTGLVWINGY